MIIREAEAKDAIRVSLLILARENAFDAPPEVKKSTLMGVVGMIESPAHQVIVAEDLKDGVVGMMLGELVMQKANAWALFLMPEHRKFGTAKKMIDFGIDLARKLGCTSIRFKTGPEGKGYYETMGAEVVELEYSLCLG